jgi:endonuclease G, mitochondrial
MLIPQKTLAETEQRYHARDRARVAGREKSWVDVALAAETPERIQKRMERINLPRGVAAADPDTLIRSAAWSPGAALDVLRYERVLGRSDLIGINFLHCGYQAANSVARVVLRGSDRTISGYGTGFLVSPRLMLTNNHVLDSVESAATAEVQFSYEDGADGKMRSMVGFALDPGEFFITNGQLDYTLVAVKAPVEKLADFGYVRLIESEGKALVGEFVNIIQHPNGEPKQLAIRENQIVDLLDNFIHYQTDTAPGSSGSPLFNDQWEVIGLHHSGVPDRRDGKLVTVDGKIWTPDLGEHRIRWIANEGVRISRIIKDFKQRATRANERKLVDQVFAAAPPNGRGEALDQRPLNGGTTPGSRGPEMGAGLAVWTIPLTVAVNLGTAPAVPTATVQPPSAEKPEAVPPPVVAPVTPVEDGLMSGGGVSVEERTMSVQDYSGRKGYDPAFLGRDQMVALPGLGLWSADAPTVSGAPGDQSPVLRYTNFSVVMSKSRRMPVLTAVNIDGQQLRALPRKGDVWYFDPRIPREFQVGNELYARNPLDRGHMVRRLDPVWGDQARTANEDTFHYTNACPQHANLNQKSWNDLENYVLDNAGAQALKVCVFTGPVLREDDPDYREVQLPREFWKIAVLIDEETGQLAATGYLLSQSKMITNLQEFAFGRFRTYQVAIARITRMTGLDFGHLIAADPFSELSSREALTTEHVISGPGDIVFSRRPRPRLQAANY